VLDDEGCTPLCHARVLYRKPFFTQQRSLPSAPGLRAAVAAAGVLGAAGTPPGRSARQSASPGATQAGAPEKGMIWIEGRARHYWQNPYHTHALSGSEISGARAKEARSMSHARSEETRRTPPPRESRRLRFKQQSRPPALHFHATMSTEETTHADVARACYYSPNRIRAYGIYARSRSYRYATPRRPFRVTPARHVRHASSLCANAIATGIYVMRDARPRPSREHAQPSRSHAAALRQPYAGEVRAGLRGQAGRRRREEEIRWERYEPFRECR